MGTFRSRGAARKESSLKALFSRTGVPRIEELKDSSVTSQVTPGAGTGVSYLGQEVAMRGRNQCKKMMLCTIKRTIHVGWSRAKRFLVLVSRVGS